ncbi:hypothetical protein ACJX0J_020145, partial [Zea mays]
YMILWHMRKVLIIDMLNNLILTPDGDGYEGYGEEHNWNHICCLWELPYANVTLERYFGAMFLVKGHTPKATPEFLCCQNILGDFPHLYITTYYKMFACIGFVGMFNNKVQGNHESDKEESS